MPANKLQVAVAIAGAAAIVASTGGGLGPLNIDFDGPITLPPSVFVSPGQLTVQVGTAAVFNANAFFLTNRSYSWCRASKGSDDCVTLADATGSIYTIASASLADDGARFQVTVHGNEGTVTSAFATLAVSPLPAVVFADGEFLAADWSVSAVAIPSLGGPTFSSSQAAQGGNPGGYRVVTYDAYSSQGSVRVFHDGLSALYHPTSQGAIYLIDLSLDCIYKSASSSGLSWNFMIEQSGRRFSPTGTIGVCGTGWTKAARTALTRDDFALTDGPPCGEGETCPDFSNAGAPIRLGWVASADRPPGGAASLEYGFDNWRAGVWRR